MTSLRTVIGLCGLLLYCGFADSESSPSGNWPRFRGPNGSGVAGDKNIPVEWTKKDILWKTAIPGTGISSPIVWGERIFLQTAPTSNQRSLVCVSAADGKLLWSQPVASGSGKIHARSSLASSTPATDGKRVYVAFWNGKTVSLNAFDFDGKQIWNRELGPFASEHGFGASPIVHDGKVILNDDQDGAAELIAFDAATGKDAWRVKRTAYRTCYSTPFVIEQKGAPPELIVTSSAGIAGYDPQTGAENWHFDWKFDGDPLRTVGSSVCNDQGLIVANSGNGKGDRFTIGIKKGDKGDVTKTNLLWENKKNVPYVPSMLIRGEHIYFVNDKGFAGCVEAKTGKSIWFERLGKGFSASPVLIDGKVYAPGEEGIVYVFEAAATFKLLAKNALGEDVFASPAVAGDRLFVRGKTQLFCIGKPAEK